MEKKISFCQKSSSGFRGSKESQIYLGVLFQKLLVKRKKIRVERSRKENYAYDRTISNGKIILRSRRRLLFFTGHARETREGERKLLLLFSPRASSRFLASP